MSWLLRYADLPDGCTCPGACDCADLSDVQVAGHLADIYEATTPLHKRGLETATGRPSLSRATSMGNQRHAGLPPARVAHPQARDEVRVRSTLYPVGDVIAFPTRPPVPPEAAA